MLIKRPAIGYLQFNSKEMAVWGNYRLIKMLTVWLPKNNNKIVFKYILEQIIVINQGKQFHVEKDFFILM